MGNIDLYRDKEKRRNYLREYSKKWRVSEKGRTYFREYMRRTRGSLPGHSNQSEHELGKTYEQLALSLLPGSHISIDRNFDIQWNNKLVEVKVRNFCHSKKCWPFRKNNNSLATHYLFFCKQHTNIEKILFIPSTEFSVGIGVSKQSKWDKYKLM